MPLGISKKTWLGVAREATSGTAITTPTLYVPTKSAMKQMVKREYLDEERGDRNGVYDGITTTRWTDWDLKGPFYPDSHAYFLIAALGSNTSVQPNSGSAPNVWKHTLSLADIPPSMTLHKSYAAQFYYAPYSCVEKFTFKIGGPEKLMEFDASGKAVWAVINGTPPTPAFTQVQPFSGYAPTLKLFNATTTDIADITISFEQKVTLWFPLNGAQDWVTAYYGERKVHVDFTARFDNDTLYQRFRTGNGYDMFNLDIQGANIQSTYNYETNITIPIIGYDSMEHDAGKDNVLIKAKATALATKQTINSQAQDGTGNNLFQMWVQNSISNSYTV